MVGLEVLADGGLAPLHVQLAEGAGPRLYCEIIMRVLLPEDETALFIERRWPVQSWGEMPTSVLLLCAKQTMTKESIQKSSERGNGRDRL